MPEQFGAPLNLAHCITLSLKYIQISTNEKDF